MNRLKIYFMTENAISFPVEQIVVDNATNRVKKAPSVFEIAALVEDRSLPERTREAVLTEKLNLFLSWHRQRLELHPLQ